MKHTLCTLLFVRCGSFEVKPELMQSLEEARQLADKNDVLSSSEDESSDQIGEIDWEEVPSSLPEAIGPMPVYESHMSSTQMQPRALDPSTAGGLVSSAAASVASLWRAATGRPN